MWPDVVNAIFEAAGGVAIFGHCWKLLKDKLVRGVYWPATVFFVCWSMWNLWYYPSLGQWYSFSAGLLIAAANIAWCGLLVYYIALENRKVHGLDK